jgi:anti-sigma-K factor RskA
VSDEIHELAGAYATDALDDRERASFEQHLTACADCRDETAAYREVLAAVAGADPAMPPDRVEEAVLAAARAGSAGATPPEAPERGATGGAAGPDGGATVDHDGAVLPLAPRTRRVSALLGLAAASVALFASGVLVGRQATPSDPVTVADATASVVAVAAAEDAHFLPVALMGTESRVVMSSEMDKTVFLSSGLPTPAKGMCYQVWRVTGDGAMESAGTFTPDSDGHIAVVLEGGTQDVTKFMVTMEPPGGSDNPTGEMLGEVTT